MEWITKHWLELMAIYTGLVTIASIIVKLTPTNKDNVWLEKFITFMKLIALNKEKK